MGVMTSRVTVLRYIHVYIYFAFLLLSFFL